MAGMEQLEIHSKSYLVRWINVPAGHTISWTIQPHKKSLNLGLFKHPGANPGTTPNLSSSTIDPPAASSPADNNTLALPTATRPRSGSRNDNSWVVEKLQSLGLKLVAWKGKCEADKVTVGQYDVPEGEGGMYGLCLDNTFSKTVSKTCTFMMMSYPTNAPPKSGHHLHFSQAPAGGPPPPLQGKPSPHLGSDSSESLAHDPNKTVGTGPRPKSSYGVESKDASGSAFYTGILQKKRRKRNQGYARRFFSLDLTTATLSYYRNNHSSALRGAIPLSLAAISANEKTREISVDSGAEVWHLRANNAKDFEGWRDALERASRSAETSRTPVAEVTGPDGGLAVPSDLPPPDDDRDWEKAEALVGRVAGIRDAVRRLAKDTESKMVPVAPSAGKSDPMSPGGQSDSQSAVSDYFADDSASAKVSFWKRKPSGSGANQSGLFRRSVSSQLAVPASESAPPVPPLPNGVKPVPTSKPPAPAPPADESVHANCVAVLKDLDAVVSEFRELLVQHKQKASAGLPERPAPSHRLSMVSTASSDEFFDAVDGDPAAKSTFLTIRRDSHDMDGEARTDDVSDGESESSSDGESGGGGGGGTLTHPPTEGDPGIFPTKPKSLTPLPLDPVPRRTTIAPPKVPPPSLIGFLRKNVGKDLSTIAMPVSANEPLSLLQSVAEAFEYTELLDGAIGAAAETGERLLHVAAFAVSGFAKARVKERAVRKPFNPMLGETYELVREDKGFRFLAEKISHRPVRMACQAESAGWTVIQAPLPVQKFWGKSAELNTDGRARLFFHALGGEQYSWTLATSFLRNIIAGEKYLEPVGSMTVTCDSTGAKALVTFKAGGMFAGRSEDLTIQAFSPSGSPLPLGLAGKWTQSLHWTRDGAPDPARPPIWTAGPLVDQPEKHYGFTRFAAALNEITPVERDHLPPTDSRLRPDQRAVEDGALDRAEALKARLEERQRARRRVMEEHGERWVPRWFVRAGEAQDGGEAEAGAGADEVWMLRTGAQGYWERRAAAGMLGGVWEGVREVFET